MIYSNLSEMEFRKTPEDKKYFLSISGYFLSRTEHKLIQSFDLKAH